MKRLQSIENALIEINDVVFQELCDSFLALRNKNYIAFSRIGSQTGKQKSTKGTPDSFLLLPSGHYIFVEHTTNVSNKNKLKESIQKCLEEEKTKVSIEDIIEIILCTNFNLDTEEIKELERTLEGKHIKLEFYTLDRLAIELFYNHPNLCHKYLGMSLDTGQIVSIKQFIDEYNKAANNIATPLDNEFLHRETEIEQLCKEINNTDFLIITGSPGVGKTKLALEGINSFLTQNQNFNAYCLSYKNAHLLEDLYQYFDQNNDYILFVDDANRIDSFNQIIGFYKTIRKGKLKIIITVRDYALNEIATRCIEFSPYKLYLNKFTDEQIIDIIKSDSFKIYNHDFQKEIVRIADGNPRLAIMTAKLAIKEQNLSALSDVSDLFEHYFTKFVSDNVDFTNPIILKSLGLIGFFYTIPYKDKNRCTVLLKNFGLDYSDFVESIDLLNRLELVELQFEYVKISEQNLATFFFYKSFFKEELLSFSYLLEKYYDSNIERFRDTIIPANNTFGYHNVIEKVKPALLNYLENIKVNEEKVFNLFSTFWFYLEEETIEFIYYQVNRIPEPQNPTYFTTYETNQFSYDRNKLLGILSNFFVYPSKLKDALELGYEYSRKLPETLPELIYIIRARLLFDAKDKRMGYKRQELLIDLLLDKGEKGEGVYELTFPALAVSFLQFTYHHTESIRNNKISIYNFPFPLNDVTKELRTKIWEKINKDFKKHEKVYTQLLIEYAQRTPDVVKEVMEFDVEFVLQIIKNHLTSSDFQNCYYVQEQIHWFVENDIHKNEFDSLRHAFINVRYLIYLKIDWDSIRDKKSYEFEDYSEYEKLKENEVRENFNFCSVEEFIEFYSHYVYLLNWEKNTYNIKKSFDLIIDENFKRKFDIGIEIMDFIIKQNNDAQWIPYLSFQKLLYDKNKVRIIWDTISTRNFNQSIAWRLQYFYSLDEKFVNKTQCQNLITTIRLINDYIFIYFSDLLKYLKYDENIFSTILKIIVEKWDKERLSIRISPNFFSQNCEYLKKDLKTVKKAYIQQNEFNHYDYSGSELLSILKNDKSFIMEYVEYLYSSKNRHRSYENKNLAVVWLVDNIQDELFKVFDFIAEKEIYMGILDHFCNSFFLEIKREETIIKSNEFIINYINANYNNLKKMNMIVDVLRHTKLEFFEQAYLHFLKLGQEVSLFSQIFWIGNGGTTNGNESLGERMAFEWREIMKLTDKLDLGIKLIPIKKFIHDEIESALRFAEEEKRRRFFDKF